eukprot:4676153-Amphidinium_carterae.1
MRAVEDSARRSLTVDEAMALQCIRACVYKARPVVVQAVPKSQPVLLYTDGAVETGHCGYGAVLAVPRKEIRVLKGIVQEETLNRWIRLEGTWDQTLHFSGGD